MKISIVIPCFRSENYLSTVVTQIIETIKNKLDYEIILVNDGSSKQLWDVIKNICDNYKPNVKGINFSRNFGQHAALMAGYRESIGDIVFQMDDDGQCDPKGIFLLLNKIEAGADIVFARYEKTEKSFFRKIGSEFNRKMCISLIGMPKDLYPTSFSAARRYVVNEIIKYDKPYPYIGGLFFRTTKNLEQVVIHHKKRVEGKSSYNLRKLIKLWTNGFTAFSVKPLEIASISGIIFALIGFILAVSIILKKLLGYDSVVGWTSVISMMLILNGLLMFMIGLVGEYIGRIYICLNNSPQYVIKDKYEFKDKNIND